MGSSPVLPDRVGAAREAGWSTPLKPMLRRGSERSSIGWANLCSLASLTRISKKRDSRVERLGEQLRWEKRPFGPGERRAQKLASRRARKELLKIPWLRFREAYNAYPQWLALSFWLRAVVELRGHATPAVMNTLGLRCPDFVSTVRRSLEPNLIGFQLLEWVHNNVFRDTEQEGWCNRLHSLPQDTSIRAQPARSGSNVKKTRAEFHRECSSRSRAGDDAALKWWSVAKARVPGWQPQSTDISDSSQSLRGSIPCSSMGRKFRNR